MSVNIAKRTYRRTEHCDWDRRSLNDSRSVLIATLMCLLAVSDETRLSSLIIGSDNVMPATAVVWLCEMAVEMHRKVIGRLLIYYRPFARMLFFAHVQNVRLRTDDNQSRINCFLAKIRYFTHKMRKCKSLWDFFYEERIIFVIFVTAINHYDIWCVLLKIKRLKIFFSLRKWIIIAQREAIFVCWRSTLSF